LTKIILKKNTKTKKNEKEEDNFGKKKTCEQWRKKTCKEWKKIKNKKKIQKQKNKTSEKGYSTFFMYFRVLVNSNGKLVMITRSV